MQVDLSQSNGKKTATWKNYQQPISQGQFYTLLSCAKNHDRVLLLNLKPEDISTWIYFRGDGPNKEWVIIFKANSLNRIEWY